MMSMMAMILGAAAMLQPADIEVEGPSRTAALAAMQSLEESRPAYFTKPVCPGVGGLAPELSATILAEARGLLAEAGVALGEDGACDPNLFIIVTNDGSEALRSLRRRQPTLFNGMSAPDVRALTDSAGPARFFKSAVERGADGRELTQGGGPVLGLGGSEGGQQLSTTRNSRVGSSVRYDVEQSFVYLDADAIRGLTLQQIGHYGAMVGTLPVARSRLDEVGQPSILSLFEGGDAPAEATAFDKMLLQAAN